MALLPSRLKTKRGALYALGGLLVLAVAAFAFVYFVLFPTSAPKKFEVSATATPAAAAASATAASAGGVGGTWTVANGSAAGYRVREKLANLPAQSDAVGRTSAITGDAKLTASGDTVTVTSAAFKIDVSQLTSDQGMRDQRIHGIGLESDQFPTATFELAGPLKLPADTLKGGVVKVDATGTFNIHGVAKKETVPLQMRVTDKAIEAVGSLTFPWSEFGMTAPSVGGFVSVSDKATMEFDLHLARA